MRFYRYLCNNCSHTFTVANGSTPCPKCGVNDATDITTRGEAAGIGSVAGSPMFDAGGTPPVTVTVRSAAADARRCIAMQVLDTLEWGNKKHGNEFASTHEAIAVLREEYLELEQEVFHGTDRRRIREEALQVAAVAIKLIMHVDGTQDGGSQ